MNRFTIDGPCPKCGNNNERLPTRRGLIAKNYSIRFRYRWGYMWLKCRRCKARWLEFPMDAKPAVSSPEWTAGLIEGFRRLRA